MLFLNNINLGYLNHTMVACQTHALLFCQNIFVIFGIEIILTPSQTRNK